MDFSKEVFTGHVAGMSYDLYHVGGRGCIKLCRLTHSLTHYATRVWGINPYMFFMFTPLWSNVRHSSE